MKKIKINVGKRFFSFEILKLAQIVLQCPRTHFIIDPAGQWSISKERFPSPSIYCSDIINSFTFYVPCNSIFPRVG